jgi:RNA polymerase sigma-70 factor (ECF subfamily)
MLTSCLADDEVVVHAQNAQREAQRRIFFDELVRRFQGSAYAHAYAILGDAQLAEDAVQEGFLAAYQLLPQLRRPQAFAAWLRRIIHTQCRRLLDQERRFTPSPELAAELAATEPSPHALLEYSELQKAIDSTIKSLPQSQQAPVTLYYLDDYSQVEIARTLNLSLAAVKKRLERARNEMEMRMQSMAQEYLNTTAQGHAETTGQFSRLMDSAAEEGQYVLLETLLMEGMDVDEQDANGQTLLHWAAAQGHVEAVELLLRYGADATRGDHTGRTPLQLAVEGRHAEVAKLLRQVALQR